MKVKVEELNEMIGNSIADKIKDQMAAMWQQLNDINEQLSKINDELTVLASVEVRLKEVVTIDKNKDGK